MSKYARIENGLVIEFFETDGNIYDYFPIGLVWVNVDGVTGIAQGWTAVETDGVWQFAEYVPPPPTDAEIAAANVLKLQFETQLSTAQKTALATRVGTIQDAIELDMATPEEVAELPVRQAQLVEWKRYAVFLGRVTLQTGWALTVEWPAQPAAGMDLTVSAVAKPVQAS